MTAPTAECIGASINRIGQDMMQRGINGQLPLQGSLTRSLHDGRKKDFVLPHPKQHLANCLQFCKLRKDQIDRIPYTLIRSFFDPVVIGFIVAHCDRHKQLATPSLLLHRLHRALTKHRRFHLAHRPFHSEQQSIVRHTWIIDAIFIDDDGLDESAKLQKRVPIAAIARSREASIDNTAPTRRAQIAASSFSKPGRATPPPDRPRSSSITCTSGNPSWCARSTNPYCRLPLSVLFAT